MKTSVIKGQERWKLIITLLQNLLYSTLVAFTYLTFLLKKTSNIDHFKEKTSSIVLKTRSFHGIF